MEDSNHNDSHRPNSFIPEGDESFIMSRTVSVTGSELECQFEDLQNLNDSTSLPKTSIQPSEDQGSPVGYPEENKLNGVNDEQSAQEDDLEDSLMRRRESSPFIKTVVAERKIAQYDDFTMNSWAELQETLKSNYFVIKNESESKEKILKELDDLIHKYNSLHLRIRENNEKIKRKLDKDEVKEEELIKVILDEKNGGLAGIGDAVSFAKRLVSCIYKEPKILATLVKNNQNLASLKVLEETLCTTFYEDIIADEAYDDDLIRLLTELLEVEFENADKPADLLKNNLFTNKMLSSYLKRPECKRYVKSILKDPLLVSVKETTKIRLDPEELARAIEKRKQQKLAATSSMMKSDIKKTRTETIAIQPNSALMTEDSERPTRPPSKTIVSGEEFSQLPVPKFVAKRNKSENMTVKSPEKIQTEVVMESKSLLEQIQSADAQKNASPYKGVLNKDVIHILDKNFRLVRKLCTILIQSIFDHLYSMPIGLRILCKIMFKLAEKKFEKSGSKEHIKIIGNYLFRVWISPHFLFPLHNGVLEDFHESEDMRNNLVEIAEVLKATFLFQEYPSTNVRSVLNDYMIEMRSSVIEYYKELIAVNSDLVEQICSGKNFSKNRLKSRAICISLNEIQLICEAIMRQREEIKMVNPKVENLAEKMMFYERENRIFSSEKYDPVSRAKITASQSFVLFYKIKFPKHLIKNYLEEFNSIKGFKKDLPEDQKLLLRAKHLLKQFLIGIEDIKNIMKLATHGKTNLDDILEKYQDKLYSYEAKHSNKEKTPMHISARYLVSILKKLDQSYTQNNYYKLYKEMFEDFKAMANMLDYSISTIKLQLLKASDNLHRNCKALNEVNEKKMKALKKTYVREFIKNIKIPLCITSPSTMKNLEDRTQRAGLSTKKKPTSNTTSDRIEITWTEEKGCMHERFAIIRELAANGTPVSMGKSLGGSKSSMIGGGGKGAFGDDIFNINNYHCTTIDEFITIFGNLQEVKEAVRDGKDPYGVNDAIIFYYNKISHGVKVSFKNVSDEEYNLIMDEIENYICKRLYTKVFPAVESEKDRAFWKRCKELEWINFDHLEIIERNRCIEMWEYAASVLNQMDNRLTPLEKLDCIVECFKTITQVLELASAKEGGGGADETLPIMIYVLLSACPKRIHTNINFVTLLRDSEKMQAREGYCFTQVESAVLTILGLNHHFFKMEEEEYNRLVNEKRIQYKL